MILCCGEALIDMLPRQLADGSDVFLPVPGGAVFNTAIALGRLGEDTGFVAGVSTDMFGEQLAAHLEESGVSTAYCVRSPKPTTLAFVKLTDGHARYTFVDENTAGRTLVIDALPRLPDSVQALHFGAISLIPETCGSAFEELLRRSRSNAVVSLDPNIRPSFIEDEPGYRGRIGRMLEMSDIIKVSDEDVAWLEPGADIRSVACDWLEAGASIVTLTLGDRGARAITAALDVTVPAKEVRAVDTVGAGDTFNAGFLASLRASGALTKGALGTISEEALRTALEFASTVAAFTVGRAGANPPWKHEIQAADGSDLHTSR